MSKSKISNDERYTQLSDDIKDYFNDIVNKSSILPHNVDFVYIQDYKAKEYIEVKNITGIHKHLNNADIAVVINEKYHDLLDDEAKQILIEQAINRISINLETGKIKLIKPDLTTFTGILKKYGLEKVTRANNLTKLIDEGQQDQEDAVVIEDDSDFLR